MKLITPTIHLNGTNSKDLIRERFEIISVLHTLMRAIADAAPNGRDHYLTGTQGLTDALKCHRERLLWIGEYVEALTCEIELIEKQAEKRTF